jgi:hypothetical protein
MNEQEERAFEQRWTAWQQRGQANERVTRQRLLIALPIVASVAVGALWYLA